MTIENVQVQFPRDWDEVVANMALEVKDDENKSNDHHQISNNWSESWRHSSEKAPFPDEVLVMNLIRS